MVFLESRKEFVLVLFDLVLRYHVWAIVSKKTPTTLLPSNEN